MIRRFLKFLVVLALLGFAGLAAYAWLGDLSPVQEPQTLTVTLDAK